GGVLVLTPAVRLVRLRRWFGRRSASLNALTRHGDGDPGLLLVGRQADQCHAAGADGVAGGEGQPPELAGVEPVTPGGDDAVGRAGRQRGRLDHRLAGAGRFGLVPEGLELLLELLDAVGQFGRRDLQRLGGPAQLPLLVVDAIDGDVARDCLDPSEVRADRLLVDDLYRPDEPERVDVGAATQLDRVIPRFEHAHEVSVLLTEE